MGRPSSFTQEIADTICQRIADGEALKDICAGDDMPERATVYNWINKDQNGFFDMYARAREAQADTRADEIVPISDDKDEDANSRRVRIDARKWVAAKLRPKKYGDKLDLEHSGTVGVEFITIYEKDE